MIPAALFIGSVALSLFSRPQRRWTIGDLESALHAETMEEYGADKPGAAEIFLTMEPTDVPDHLLLAVILSGATRNSPVDTALELIHRSRGDLERVADPSLFDEVWGIGSAGRARLLAAEELYRRAHYRSQTARRKQILSPHDAEAYLRSMSTGPYERLSALYLNTANHVVGTRVITQGSDMFTVVEPRQILRPAVEMRARGIILAHQHPSGRLEFSPQDREVTERIATAAQAIGVDLLDHMVLTAGGAISMAEQGILPSRYAQPPMVTR